MELRLTGKLRHYKTAVVASCPELDVLSQGNDDADARRMLADHFNESADTAMYRVEEFEKQVKERFIKHPGQMKLLIVVDKLL
ncbi:MAG: hypothetical protein AAB289_01680, partial [Chloroflexota bacterium]